MLLRAVNRWNDRRTLRRIAALELELQNLSDEELRSRSHLLRHRAKAGAKPRQLTVEAFALVREAGRRSVGMRHFDVQLIGGMTLVRNGLAEMQTGEGKTLTATLPTVVYALYGRGAHVATVNDYLARRDAELMRPVYEALGLTVGIIESGSEPDSRRGAYACDVTYGTGKEFGFDYLRDRLLLRKHEDQGTDVVGRWLGRPKAAAAERPVQREAFFMLVDEADSVLIDDAGTPLIIAAEAAQVKPAERARYEFAAQHAKSFRDRLHYHFDAIKHRVELTFSGRERLRSLPQPRELSSVGLVTLYEDAERAILVERLYRRDRNYVVASEVEPGESTIAIVDEFTGRIAEGRKWRGGLHQAVEAKENQPITGDGGQAARITVQEFFLRYRHLSGMSGTAYGSAKELRRIYKLRTRPIPTNRPPIREQRSTVIVSDHFLKLKRIMEEVAEIHRTGRPILIGTRSIERSLELSELLRSAGIVHDVLNAHEEAREAEIVAGAGEQGRVTVATNMAGRGTDIRLGRGVRELGGLHVIMTEMHESSRVDRQLIGRCGRQGDPGSFRLILSLEDDLLREGLGAKRHRRYLHRKQNRLSPNKVSERLYRKAQRRVERKKFRQRKSLLTTEKRRNLSAKPLGLDPHLDLPS
jgi:preprotein translocase subunit SecA